VLFQSVLLSILAGVQLHDLLLVHKDEILLVSPVRRLDLRVWIRLIILIVADFIYITPAALDVQPFEVGDREWRVVNGWAMYGLRLMEVMCFAFSGPMAATKAARFFWLRAVANPRAGPRKPKNVFEE